MHETVLTENMSAHDGLGRSFRVWQGIEGRECEFQMRLPLIPWKMTCPRAGQKGMSIHMVLLVEFSEMLGRGLTLAAKFACR